LNYFKDRFYIKPLKKPKDNGLDKINGIKSHKVQLNNNKALISGENISELIPKASNLALKI
jgi:hypothetical protein